MGLDLGHLPVPIVAAPMAGGPTTPELVAAVSAAGAVGFLAAGYRTAAQFEAEIAKTSGLTDRPFGANLFVPSPGETDESAVSVYRDRLKADAERLGVELPETVTNDDDGWAEKIEVLLRRPVAAVSFTFGLPTPEVVAQLKGVGSTLIGTVTSVEEARQAVEVGMDALTVQGPEAGGHRGTHRLTDIPGTMPLTELLPAVGESVDVPLLAAGGLATPEDVARVLRLGAVAAQIGTLYLLADEAGTSGTHRDALARGGRETVVTRAFTGRAARGVRNRFIDEHEADAPWLYPQIHQLTRPLRVAAARQGDAESLHLWAGTGYEHARPGPAEQITHNLWKAVTRL
jgi:nitronate monooxygenase